MITVGLDVGGTFLKAAVVEDGAIIAERTEPVPAADVLAFVTGVAQELIDSYSAAALGVGVAGLVRWPEGRFVWGPHVSGLGVPYRASLAQVLGVPVVVDNDANLAALAEARTGAGRGADNVVMLTIGTGIGAGMVLGGRVHRGRSHAGEVGHMTMQPDGAPCACGLRGCWETLVSGRRLDQEAAALALRDPEGLVAGLSSGAQPTAVHLSAAAAAGDEAAKAVLADAGRWLGRGMANLVAILDPDVVVVGGAVVLAGASLLDPARSAIASHLTGAGHRAAVPVVTARHGRMAGSVGAALLAAESAGRSIEEPS